MLKKLIHNIEWKKKLFQVQSFFLAKLINGALFLLLKTCRIKIKGLDLFSSLASKEKCLLMLWHNRLAPALFILSRYTKNIEYAAVVSASRDGDVLSNIIHSYKNGNTIRVPHLGRYQALQAIINRLKEGKQVVVITPDGPRGPRYEVKPGIAIAALETEAYIFTLNWEAKKYWELNSWDKFRIPKPFTTLHVTIGQPVHFNQTPKFSLKEAQAFLKANLKKN